MPVGSFHVLTAVLNSLIDYCLLSYHFINFLTAAFFWTIFGQWGCSSHRLDGSEFQFCSYNSKISSLKTAWYADVVFPCIWLELITLVVAIWWSHLCYSCFTDVIQILFNPKYPSLMLRKEWLCPWFYSVRTPVCGLNAYIVQDEVSGSFSHSIFISL